MQILSAFMNSNRLPHLAAMPSGISSNMCPLQVELCHVASQFFDSEADRRDDVTAVLIRYLKCYSARFMISFGESSQPSVTDGTATVLLSGVRHPPFAILTLSGIVCCNMPRTFT